MSNLSLNPIMGSGFVRGTLGDDSILGSPTVDVINASAGHDSVWGDGGDDVLIGGAGDDYVVGGDNMSSGTDNDYIVGTDYAAAGEGERDVLVGGAGADVFVLGEVKAALVQGDQRQDELIGQPDPQKQYYLDGWGDGNTSYAVIADFRPDQGDTIQLIAPQYMGNAFAQPTYIVAPSPIADVPGSAIYLQSSFNSIPADLVAIVQFPGEGDRTVDLQADYMTYVGDSQTLFLEPPITPTISPF